MNIEENDRDVRLSNFNEIHKSNLENLMKRQDLQIREGYSKLFDDELSQAERFAKSGDHVNAALQAFIAARINDYLKTLI
jgi:hypothetical protein